jgi:hypothetical protein
MVVRKEIEDDVMKGPEFTDDDVSNLNTVESKAAEDAEPHKFDFVGAHFMRFWPDVVEKEKE